MVEWTDSERSTITAVWDRINVDEMGPETLKRVLIVYPWTKRYFGRFGDISSTAAVLANDKVANHGKVVLKALDKAVENMDDMHSVYAPLSQLHCEKFNVDPVEFRLFADCLTIAVGCKLGKDFPPHVQGTWQKFLSAVVEALSSFYF
ncbi:hemoglobin, beta adult 2 [Diretmus argenteus]